MTGFPDEWQSQQLDLDAYLHRIAYTGPVEPNGQLLKALHRAHIATIPFENLDIILGRGIQVDLEHVQVKLVNHNRGGYCYEHAMLFGAALERLGYQVDRLLARTGDPAEHPRPRSHMVLAVGTGHERWLADVGFGSGLLEPLPLTDTGPQRQGAWTFQLVRGEDEAWRLKEHQGADWVTLMTIAEERQYWVDVDVANYNTATNPHSPFVQQPIVVRKDDTMVRRLLGREFARVQPDQSASVRRLTDEEFAETLRVDFGLSLSAQELTAVLATVPPDATGNPTEAGAPPSRQG